jgi:hypothetical protein
LVAFGDDPCGLMSIESSEGLVHIDLTVILYFHSVIHLLLGDSEHQVMARRAQGILNSSRELFHMLNVCKIHIEDRGSRREAIRKGGR